MQFGPVHCFRQRSYHIVLDTNSGTVHSVSEIAYDIIENSLPPLEERCPEQLRGKLKQYTKEELTEAYADVYELYRCGMLFSQEAGSAVFHDAPIPVKALCLHISHDCNMRCKYCFASTGDFRHGRELMPFEVGKAAMDFLMERSLGRRNLEVDFFGGEPLMNLDVVKQVVAYTREKEKEYGKNTRFTLTTNGVLLDGETIDFLNREMSNIVLSIDGRKSVNDAMRPLVGGKPSYDLILPKMKALVEKRRHLDEERQSYYVRGTFTRENLDFSKDVLHLADEGFDQISIEPVVLAETSKYAIREEDLAVIGEEYERLADRMIEYKESGRGFHFFHFLIDLDGGPCLYKRTKGCGSGSEYLAVTPDGNIYPCHQFADNDDFILGNVLSGQLEDEKRLRFARSNINTKEECRQCWAKYFCGGGCAANHYNFNRDIDKPYKIACALQKKRLECAIMLKVYEYGCRKE